MIYLSVVVPVFNEEKRLQGLAKIHQFLKLQKFSSELIVVNDGSTDKTLSKLEELQKTVPFVIGSYQQNRGKGYAIKTGMLQARGKYRLFTDVDLSTPLIEFEKFKDYLDKYDLVIGSRKMRGAKLLKRQPIIRESLGKVFTALSQFVLGVRVSDFTCGFKCFSAKAAENIFSQTMIERWGFDSEVLFLAKKLGFNIKEVPVEWRNDQASRVRFPQDAINSLSELITIKKNVALGRYQ